MDWLVITAASIEAATEQAAEQLNVAAAKLEIEIVEEPVAGLFGRTRGNATIRARVAGARKKKATAAEPAATEPGSAGSVRPATRPRASASALAAVASVASAPEKPSRGPRRPASSGSAAPRAPRPPRDADEPVETAAVVASAAKFLEGLLRAAELDGKVSHRVVDAETVEVSVNGDGLGMLIGPKGQTLLAVQELLRTFVHHDTGGRSGRLMLDVGGYREKRRAALQTFTRQVAASVVETGERRVLEPMNAVDRKVVHDTVGTIDGVSSVSEGEDPNRYVVLLPAD